MNERMTSALDLSTSAWRLIVRGAMRAYLLALATAARIGPGRSPSQGGKRVLLTGTFHSDNWIRAHLGPLAASPACGVVTMVTTSPLPDLPNVVALLPPGWLRRVTGDIPARLLTFVWVALTTRPDVIGGFHLLVNGLVAALMARVTGAESWYFCVGGITELRDGGVWGENKYFARLRRPDAVVERQLLRAVATFDLIITMGSTAVRDLQRRGIASPRFAIISGGILDAGATPPAAAREYDAILVARLVPIKRIHLFLEAIAALREQRPATTAVIVGDGPLREDLTTHARQLGLNDAVTFAGHQTDVGQWLRRSRVFVLTSRSEGLALSMMEAMMAGLPAVVPNVGDLGDLVDDGRNGYLIETPTAAAFADALVALLDSARYGDYAHEARRSALRYSVAATTLQWNAVLEEPVHLCSTTSGSERSLS